MIRDAALAPPRQGFYARIISTGVMGGYALIVVLGALLWRVAPAQDVFSGPVLLSASFFASAMCFVAWRSLSAPANQPYGHRSGGVKDPWGNTWYIASELK